ncbi:MAG: hypothetical protein WDO71_23165 [Bacteroidota bacterium]
MKYLELLLAFCMPLLLAAQEKVFFNTRIFTADIQRPFAEAIAIKGKTIIAVALLPK